MLSRWFTRYRIPPTRPWAAIGPVWGNDGRLSGVCVQAGPYGFAVHRGV